MISANDALLELRQGNRRFASGEISTDSMARRVHRADLVSGQNPVAIVLACSDSRVPVEMVFDQGFGDLFVIRVAGNIVTPSQLGSIEFAATQFGTPLVVVLGHTDCGAVTATLDELRGTGTHHSPNLRAIVDQIQPVVAKLLDACDDDDGETLIRDAGRANIRASVAKLTGNSEILEKLVASGELTIAGAEYSLDTGEVVFFDRDIP
jgi:carbonic anhydrase